MLPSRACRKPVNSTYLFAPAPSCRVEYQQRELVGAPAEPLMLEPQ